MLWQRHSLGKGWLSLMGARTGADLRRTRVSKPPFAYTPFFDDRFDIARHGELPK